MKNIILTFLLFLGGIAKSQDLTGHWVGECKKWELSSVGFNMTMDIVQEGKQVKGQNHIAYKNEPWYCVKNLKGEIEGSTFYYEDKAFVEQKHEFGSYWLVLSGHLKYDPKKDKLFGWVNAYDPNYNEWFEKHDYIELYRKKNPL